MASSETTGEAGSRGSRRGRVMRLALLLLSWIIVPILLLALLELGLRAWGYGHTTRFLYGKPTEYGRLHVANMSFYRQFLYAEEEQIDAEPFDVVVPPKDAETYRIVVLGGSAALGWYFSDYSFWRVLDVMLRTKYPNTKFDVCNFAYFGMNSHVMRHIAEESAVLEPDLFVVYLGNNEMCGPFGLESVLGRKHLSSKRLDALIKAHLLMADLRLMQFVGAPAQKFFFRSLGGMKWGLDAPIGSLDDPRLHRVYEHYEQNLEAICDAAKEAGAGVVLCTVGRSLRDWRPQCSVHSDPYYNGPDKDTWKALYEAGIQQENDEAYGDAIRSYEEAVAIDDQYADLEFRLGTCYYATGDYDRARALFMRALEHDFNFAGANSHINGAIGRAAKNKADGVYFVDTAQRLIDLSPHGISDRKFFYDHIHLTFEGNYEIARAVFERIADTLPEWVRDDLDGICEAPSLDDCRERMGLSRPVLLSHLTRAIQDFDTLWTTQDVDYLREHKAQVEQQVQGVGGKLMLEGYRRALELDGRDFHIRLRYVKALLGGDEAVRQARELVARFPHQWRSHFALGDALNKAGRREEALEALRPLLALYPEHPETYYQWGAQLEANGALDEALAAFRRAAGMKAVNDLAKWGEGNVLAKSGDLEGAVRAYCAAIAVKPKGGNLPYYALDSVLEQQGDRQARTAMWREITEDHPDVPWGFLCLGAALEASGDMAGALEACRQAISLDGGLLTTASSTLAGEAGKLRAKGELTVAIQGYRAAIELDPQNALWPQQLAAALAEAGDAQAEAGLLEEAIAMSPDSPSVYQSLDAFLVKQNDAKARAAAWRNIASKHAGGGWSQYYLGMALDAVEDRDGAIVAFHKAHEQAPSDADLQMNVGTCLVRLRDFEGSIPALRKALDIKPEYNTHICPMLVKALCELEDFEAAWRQVATCKEAGVELRPDLIGKLEHDSGRTR